MSSSSGCNPEPDQEETRNLRKIREELSETRLEGAVIAEIPVPPEPPCLVQLYPATATTGRRHPIRDESVSIGREADCGIVIPDGSVSRRHARIWCRTSSEYFVEDLGSRNGTSINDIPIVRAMLRDGDFLRVGPFIYRFLAGENVEAQYQEEIHRLSVRDPLTGVHNRRSFDEFLAREAHRARRHRRPLAVAVFEVDDFDSLRDRIGHRGGDLALKEVARRLRHENRAEDLLARYAAIRFGTILPETDLEGAIMYADRLRGSVAQQPFVFEETPHRITVSAGVAVLAAGSDLPVADLVRRAESRLQEAGLAGHNCVAPFARVGEHRTPYLGNADAAPPTELLVRTSRACT